MKKSLLLLLLVSTVITAQKMKVVKGDYAALKDQKEFNVEFTYENLKLMKDNLTNDQYVSERVADLNGKNNGVGDAWKTKWYSSRELSFEPKFLELVNIVLSKKGKEIVFKKDLNQAKYTLIVDAKWIYPGYNVVMVKKGAKVSTILRFVETANKSNVVLEISSDEAPGDIFGGSFSNEDRISEGYAKTGKSLAGLLLKKAFK
ncbi:hypothetical protein HNQ02_001555 [Flavobacterium sp. 7E]|uniref:hypothetical protein n=1 Tax=unclassified Flavobacterium TaxID=196869 RepID=UPI00156FF819|nr:MULTISPECIES: hypothetical protein [unclassified Flavobacterium]MBE0390689.1 hypothetical protein [Flavobacterium sp. PL002]NRS88637.1 hypothetical protein [Flavobacterium sp. 7E]NRT14265.1 hypothetical protein [Flavobacterium sp. 28A]